jgi:hypothetical protein
MLNGRKISAESLVDRTDVPRISNGTLQGLGMHSGALHAPAIALRKGMHEIPRILELRAEAVRTRVKGLDRVSGGVAALDTARASTMLRQSGECPRSRANWARTKLRDSSIRNFIQHTFTLRWKGCAAAV